MPHRVAGLDDRVAVSMPPTVVEAWGAQTDRDTPKFFSFHTDSLAEFEERNLIGTILHTGHDAPATTPAFRFPLASE